MAATAFTNFYDLGQWGYMGVGPAPQAGFELSVAVNDPTQYVGWFTGSGVAKLGILFYKIGDTTKYAVHKTAYLSVTNSGSNYMVVGGQYAGVPNSQTVTLSYNASDWEFYGGFTAADLPGAAICFFVLDPSGTTGTAPNGLDFASISASNTTTITWAYEIAGTRFAATIDGADIFAKRAENDKNGNRIDTTYATKNELSGKQDALPSITGNGGKILAVNSGASGLEWVAKPSPGPSYSAGNMISLANDTIAVSTTAGITDVQTVAALPANPVATILYLIPET